MCKFKIGDRVRLSKQGKLRRDSAWITPYRDKIGTIVWNTDYYRVKWPDGDRWSYLTSSLVPASIFYAETDKKGLIV